MASCKARIDEALEMYKTFSIIPANGIAVKNCSLKMLNFANPYIVEFKQKSISFEMELEGWRAQEQDLIHKGQEVRIRLEQITKENVKFCENLTKRFLAWEVPSKPIPTSNHPDPDRPWDILSKPASTLKPSSPSNSK